jgi:hypothetical protein
MCMEAIRDPDIVQAVVAQNNVNQKFTYEGTLCSALRSMKESLQTPRAIQEAMTLKECSGLLCFVQS